MSVLMLGTGSLKLGLARADIIQTESEWYLCHFLNQVYFKLTVRRVMGSLLAGTEESAFLG